MPNWCYNILTIKCKDKNDAGEIRKLLELAKVGNRVLDFNKFIPYPENYRKLDEIARKWEEENIVDEKPKPGVSWADRPKDGYNQGGYEWCNRNWGTKWNAGEVYIEEKGDCEVVLSFDTAWSPPDPVVVKMGEMFPSLVLEMHSTEPNMGFECEFVVENGEVVRDEEIESQEPEEE